MHRFISEKRKLFLPILISKTHLFVKFCGQLASILSRCTDGHTLPMMGKWEASKPDFGRFMAKSSEEDFYICVTTVFHRFLSRNSQKDFCLVYYTQQNERCTLKR